MYSEVSTIYY